MPVGNKQTQVKVGDDVFTHLSNKHIIDNKGLIMMEFEKKKKKL